MSESSERQSVLVFDPAPGYYTDAMTNGVMDAAMHAQVYDDAEAASEDLDETFTAVVATLPPADATPNGRRQIGARKILIKAYDLDIPSALFTDLHGQAITGRRLRQDKFFNNWPMESSDVRRKVANWLSGLRDAEDLPQDDKPTIEIPRPGGLVLPEPTRAEEIGRFVFGSAAKMQIGMWISEREATEPFTKQDVVKATGLSASGVSHQLQNFRSLQIIERGWHQSNFRLHRRVESPVWGIFDMASLVLESLPEEG